MTMREQTFTKFIKKNPDYYQESYIFPKNPINLTPPSFDTIPLIDFRQDWTIRIAEIKNACQQYGMFKVFNTCISNDILSRALTSADDYYKESDPVPLDVSLRPSFNRYHCSYAQAEGAQAKYWRDSCFIAWRPDPDLTKWPSSPVRFVTHISELGNAFEKFEDELVMLVSEALGLEEAYFDKGLRKNSSITINNFPPCSKPEKTLGMCEHCDAGLLMTSFIGEVGGSQVFVGGEWKQVKPEDRNSSIFLVTVGNVLQVVSNKVFVAPKHREVVNNQDARLTISYLSLPDFNCDVGPAAELTRSTPARYQNFYYKEYYDEHLKVGVDTCTLLESYEIREIEID